MSDATIWSITLESSIATLEASFTLVYYVYSTGHWPLLQNFFALNQGQTLDDRMKTELSFQL